MRAVAEMQRRLTAAMTPGKELTAEPWISPVDIRKIRRDVEQQFDTIGTAPTGPTVAEAVCRYLSQNEASHFVQLKHVCYGIGLRIDGKGTPLVEQPEALSRLLAEVGRHQDEGRRYRRCYQALMQSFFSVEPHIDRQRLTFAPGAERLRAYLHAHLSVVARPLGGREAPAWVLTLQEHQNLLTDHPCDRYVEDLKAGHTRALHEVCEVLGIGQNSWVWQAVILAYLTSVCAKPDEDFKSSMSIALDLAAGQADLKPMPQIACLVVAQLVRRYRACESRPEHPRLRDAAVERIGNPWLQRPIWDAWVDDEPARQMVDTWLKSRLLEDFFTLLADQTGGATDERRLNYWLRFVPVIEDMWFVLGSSAGLKRSADFVEMRKRLGDRCRSLTSAQAMNNAFILKMGGHYFIEFGMKGNACYHYREENMSIDLGKRELSIHALKVGHQKLLHHTGWEPEFDRVICPLVMFWPKQGGQPSVTPKTKPAVEAPPWMSPPSPARGPAPVAPPSFTHPTQWKTSAAPAAASKANTAADLPAWMFGAGSNAQASSASERTAFETGRRVELVVMMSERLGISFLDKRAQGGAVQVFVSPGQFPELDDLMEKAGFTCSAPGVFSSELPLRAAAPAPAPASASTKPPASPAAIGKRWFDVAIESAEREGVVIKDMRPSGGSLWVMVAENSNPILETMLRKAGFRFAARRGGYYLESD